MLQLSISSGSDHMMSQKGPSCGISTFLSIVRIWLIVLMSGDKPLLELGMVPVDAQDLTVHDRTDRQVVE